MQKMGNVSKYIKIVFKSGLKAFSNYLKIHLKYIFKDLKNYMVSHFGINNFFTIHICQNAIKTYLT